jgi:hypothetical protein
MLVSSGRYSSVRCCGQWKLEVMQVEDEVARWWAEARQCEEHQGGREWVHAGDRSERCVIVNVEHGLDHVHQVPTESGRPQSVVVAWDGVVVG